MEIRIAGTAVAPGDVTHGAGAPGFGRFHGVSDAVQVFPYSLTLTTAQVVDAVSTTYETTCREIREDDLAHGDGSPFEEIGYCGLEHAITHHPQVLASIIRYFLLEPLLSHVLPGEGWTYVIQSVEGIEVTPGHVVLTGRCFRRVVPPGDTSRQR